VSIELIGFRMHGLGCRANNETIYRLELYRIFVTTHSKKRSADPVFGKVSDAHQVDGGLPELGAFGADHHRLRVAARGQNQVRGKVAGADDDLKPAARGRALHLAVDVARRLAPGAGQLALFGDNVAASSNL